MYARLRASLSRGIDPLGLVLFRVLLGLLFAFSALRFVLKGWVRPTYVEPSFHFRYSGLEWIPTPDLWLLYVLFGGMVLGGLGIALGALYRLSTGLWLVCFLWVELLDKSTYLNHYYLMTLLGVLALVLPLHRSGSLDVRLGLVERWDRAPRWMLWLLRFQIAVVYFFAGFAKLNADWLLRGEPMWTWLRGLDGVPLVSSLIAAQATAIAMSWAGALYDLTIPLWLSLQRTRTLAFLTVVLFHVMTWMIFPIGVFPWLMIISATLFFAPGWPRRLRFFRWHKLPQAPLADTSRLGGPMLAFVGLWCLLQVAIPLRFLAYPGEVNWNERGFRFSWRVMLIEKTGFIEYRVVDPSKDRSWLVSPRNELSPLQYKMLSTQPDMMEDYGRHLASRYADQGLSVQIYADSWVSWNGRPARPALDRNRDLANSASLGSWFDPAL